MAALWNIVYFIVFKAVLCMIVIICLLVKSTYDRVETGSICLVCVLSHA